MICEYIIRMYTDLKPSHYYYLYEKSVNQALKGVRRRRMMKAGMDDEKIPSMNSTYFRLRHGGNAEVK